MFLVENAASSAIQCTAMSLYWGPLCSCFLLTSTLQTLSPLKWTEQPLFTWNSWWITGKCTEDTSVLITVSGCVIKMFSNWRYTSNPKGLLPSIWFYWQTFIVCFLFLFLTWPTNLMQRNITAYTQKKPQHNDEQTSLAKWIAKNNQHHKSLGIWLPHCQMNGHSFLYM